jgi:transcription termination factor Rho
MYDISQLNDLLVPELLDVAEQLHISNAKKLNKQDLIDKILDKQSNMSTAKNEEEKPKRKRIIKPAEGAAPEAAHEIPEVQQQQQHPKKEIARPKLEKKPPVKKQLEEEEEELQPITDEQSTIPAAIAQMLQAEDEVQQQQPEVQQVEATTTKSPVQSAKRPTTGF